MTHTVAKPATAPDSIVSVFITSGDYDLDASKIFRMRPAEVTLDFSVQIADVTGDADINATFTHNQMTRGRFSVRGYAMGTDAVYFSNLQSVYNGMSPNTEEEEGPPAIPGTELNTNIKFNWASGHYIFGTAILEEIQMSYARSSTYVGLAMSGRFTETLLGNPAYVDNTTGTAPTAP